MPYVTYDDFVNKFSNIQCTEEQMIFQWNSLVLDKANEVIFGAERALLRSVQTMVKEQGEDAFGTLSIASKHRQKSTIGDEISIGNRGSSVHQTPIKPK